MANPYGISDEEYAQLEFYASMSGMSVDDYIAMQAKDQAAGGQAQQAPARNNLQKNTAKLTTGGYLEFSPNVRIDMSHPESAKLGAQALQKAYRAANDPSAPQPKTDEDVAAVNYIKSLPPDEAEYWNPEGPTRGMGPPGGVKDMSNPAIVGMASTPAKYQTTGGINAPKAGAAGSNTAQQQALQQAIQQTNMQTQALNTSQRDQNQAAFDQYMKPAYQGFQTASQNQITGNRQAEQGILDAGNTLNNSLNQTQAQRTAAINQANNIQTGAYNDLRGSISGINANQQGLFNTLQGQANATNANQTALFNALQGQAQSANANQTDLFNSTARQLNSISANQTGLYNTLNSNLSALNQRQDAANSAFQNQLAGLTEQQNAANASYAGGVYGTIDDQYADTARYKDELAALNVQGNQATLDYRDRLDTLTADDYDNLQRYMGLTNPLLEKMEAQKSDPKYVQQMLDQYDLYKSRSGVEATAEERLLAEQARLKNENDFKGARDATIAALQQRGLNSGGQQIAAMYGQRQQTAQDRVLAELGLQASAQQRAERNTAGAAGVANQLRTADDQMRQFQDQYAMNDSIRRQGVMNDQLGAQNTYTGNATNRETLGYNANINNINNQTTRAGLGYGADTTANSFAQQGYGNIFNAATTTNNANTQRASLGFDANTTTNSTNQSRYNDIFNAGTTTNNANTGRTGMIFDAGTTTNNNNFNRNQAVFSAGTATNDANFGRNASVANFGMAGNQLALQGAGMQYNAGSQTADSNFNRSNIGFQAADANAGTAYNSALNYNNTIIGNRAAEVGTAGAGMGFAGGMYNGQSGITNTYTEAQRQALQNALSGQVLSNVKNPDDEN